LIIKPLNPNPLNFEKSKRIAATTYKTHTTTQTEMLKMKQIRVVSVLLGLLLLSLISEAHVQKYRRKLSGNHRQNLHDFMEIIPLVDQRLCNNNPTDLYIREDYRCFNEHRHEVPCERRNADEFKCEVAQIKLISDDRTPMKESLLRHLLSELFLMSDTNKSIRRIIIHDLKESHSLVSTLVDEMIAHRVWFEVADETFPALYNSSEQQPDHVYHIVIDRYHQNYENYMRLMSAIQYPDQETCLSTPFMLNSRPADHPGWASVVTYYYGMKNNLRYGITYIHVPRSGSGAELTCFMSLEDCANKTNKWNCAFLPATNCTLPSFLQNCSTQACMQQYPDTESFSSVFTNFSEKSTYMTHKNETEYTSVVRQPAGRPRNYLQENYSHAWDSLPHFHYLQPDGAHLSSIKLYPSAVNPALTLWTYFFLRKNSFYRFKLQEYYHEFYERYPFFKREISYSQPKKTEFRCIAAHVRRGDRTVYGVNFTEYCAIHKWHSDAGCGSTELTFGQVAFLDVVKKAEFLLNFTGNSTMHTNKLNSDGERKKYNLVVASDDPFWLEEQKELYDRSHPDSKWNILTIFPSKQFNFSRKSFKDNDEYQKAIWNLRAYRGTSSGIFMHGTLHMFQQCDGFVGHFASAVTYMFYYNMCYRNNLGMAICPPAFDLRNHLPGHHPHKTKDG
jgi:hypothetical protein